METTNIKKVNSIIQVTVNAYNSNCDVFFNTENDVISTLHIDYSQVIDIEEDYDYNMDSIKELIIDEFNRINNGIYELDNDSLDTILQTIGIHISCMID